MRYTINTPRRSVAISSGYTVQIVDTEANKLIFSHGNLLIDELLYALTCHKVPIPRNFRAQLVSDSMVGSSYEVIHYHFDGDGQEKYRRGVSQD